MENADILCTSMFTNAQYRCSFTYDTNVLSGDPVCLDIEVHLLKFTARNCDL